ncbi:unnamed protein product [Taenia asiatica]|uniref:BACK domain-containing protein n=1 Tax=Taenia asiatica TaxID=60517 RepID=A0A3P6R7C6_TAEAS|nr:unnamed protein product [Taenia asiatica]
MEAFITFAYTGEIQITPGNVQATLIGASFLNIDSVRNFCCRYIEERLTLENLLQVRSFASSFLCSNLVSACDRIIHENFEHLVTLPAFFAALTGPEFCKLLESDDLQVSNEERVFHSIVAWCEHQPSPPFDADIPKLSRSLQSLQTTSTSDITATGGTMSLSLSAASSTSPPSPTSSRLKYLPDLLARVRLPLLSAQFIRDVVSKNPHVRADMACRDLLDEARDLLLMPDSLSTSTCSFVCRPRRGQEVAGVIYAVGGYSAEGDCQSIVEAYNPLVDRWEVVESMSTERSRIAVVALKGCLYAIGGLDGSSRLNTVEKFDPKTGVWQRVASMNYRRSALGAAVLNGRIYVCGGYDGISSLRTCEVYNPEQNRFFNLQAFPLFKLFKRWQVIPSMTECRSAGGVVALEDGRLFAVGGHSGLPIFASVECYHRRGHQTPLASTISAPTTTPFNPGGRRVWCQVAPMLHRRCRHGVAVLRGRIFAAGGYNGCHFLRSVEVYDPASITTTGIGNGEPGLGQWTEVASLATPRSRVALAASGGRLYAIGGFDGEQNLSSVECFQRCEISTARSHYLRRCRRIRLTDDDDGDDDGRVSVVVVDENEDETGGTSNEHHPIAITPSTSHTTLSPLDLHQHNPHHHSQRCRGRSSSLRDRQPRPCKSRDDEDLEEWLEEGQRSLLVPRVGMPFQTELTPVTAPPGAAAVTNSDASSVDLPTVTTEGLDSTESLIELLTFQSTTSSPGELGPHTSPPLQPRPPPPPPPPHPSSSTEMSTSEDDVFADWQWVPAMPLIAHEGGVGVGVIPLY